LLSTHHPTPETYTLSLHDALPISRNRRVDRPYKYRLLLESPLQAFRSVSAPQLVIPISRPWKVEMLAQSRPQVRPLARQLLLQRSEEHTSELQSLRHLVCRLLLEK